MPSPEEQHAPLQKPKEGQGPLEKPLDELESQLNKLESPAAHTKTEMAKGLHQLADAVGDIPDAASLRSAFESVKNDLTALKEAEALAKKTAVEGGKEVRALFSLADRVFDAAMPKLSQTFEHLHDAAQKEGKDFIGGKNDAVKALAASSAEIWSEAAKTAAFGIVKTSSRKV